MNERKADNKHRKGIRFLGPLAFDGYLEDTGHTMSSNILAIIYLHVKTALYQTARLISSVLHEWNMFELNHRAIG